MLSFPLVRTTSATFVIVKTAAIEPNEWELDERTLVGCLLKMKLLGRRARKISSLTEIRPCVAERSHNTVKYDIGPALELD